MQSLQQKATEWSGVATDDAFAIDETNLFQKLGLQTFIRLSTNFYTRVYDDEEEWFRSIFANSKKEDAIQNQYEFFIQRMGGPALYSQRRGHPALIGRHRPFPVTHQAAERWLHHMQQALDTTAEIDDDSKIKMMNFFRFIFCHTVQLHIYRCLFRSYFAFLVIFLGTLHIFWLLEMN
ncbi:Two-on-two hemoglobin [Arachis hypogaea]|nr:two-on-two hemoglobin-3 isoform X1 [Arachis hypogaea]QHO47006.1 Two-on-two hemoglobin [Arachis hypogaea]